VSAALSHPVLFGRLSDERLVRRLQADPSESPVTRAFAEDWLAERDPLGAGPMLGAGMVPRAERGHAELRRLRIPVALRRLESWESRQVLAVVLNDPEIQVRVSLAHELAALGDGLVLDLLARLAGADQPEVVQRAVLSAVRAHAGRLPADRVASVLRALGGASALHAELPAAWSDAARVHPWIEDAARVACEALASPSARPDVRAAAQAALASFGDDTLATPAPVSAWGRFTRFLAGSGR